MIGARTWMISGGHIPLASTGPEPAFTSRDVLSLLNVGEETAEVAIMLYFADHDPVGPYELTAPARRVRRVRVNDLIDPEAPPLDEPYGLEIRASAPIVVQFTRQDTSAVACAGFCTTAYSIDP